MSPASAILADPRAEGFRLRPDAGMIHVAPAARVIRDLAASIREHKPDPRAILFADVEAERTLAPYANLLPLAEAGYFTDAMRQRGLRSIILRPAVTTETPDLCLQAALRLAREILGDPDRRNHPTSRAPLADALEAVRVVAQLAPRTGA